jgi:DNA-directed RNA polymerase subunit RPC12/RpoP
VDRLTPLVCSACGGAVPLVAGDATACPYCAAKVEIPQAYRELRDTERTLDDEAREGRALARALAKVPSAPVRMLAMFDSALFLWVGLGFWIALGVTVGVLLPPVIGRWFGVSTVDVLDERTQGWISMVLPIGTFALGVLGAGWARKRAIVRGGLQAVLAARAPEREGGPARCRQCGAALVVAQKDHAIACPYCGTDNLVNMPAAWLSSMRTHAAKLGREVAEARKQYESERRSLRSSLIWRAVFGVVIVAVPSTCVLGAAPTRGGPIDYAAGKPGVLPSWREHRERSVPARGVCKPATVSIVGFSTRAEDCDEKGCAFHRLIPLERGEGVHVVSEAPPDGASVALQIHERLFFEDRWTTIGEAQLDADPRLRATLSAWYRIAFDVPGARAGQIVRACVETI